MKLKEEYRIGESIFLVFPYRKRDSQEMEIKEIAITKVGTIEVVAGRDRFRKLNEKNFLTSYTPGYGYDRNEIAFSTRKGAEEYIAGLRIIADIRGKMNLIGDMYDNGKISNEQLRKIADVLQK